MNTNTHSNDDHDQPERRESRSRYKEGGGDAISEASVYGALLYETHLEVKRGHDIPDRDEAISVIEWAAMMLVPELWWAFLRLATQVAGKPAKRTLIAALFMTMVFRQSCPKVNETKAQLTPSAMRDFTFGPLSGPSTDQGIYLGLDAMLNSADRPPAMWRKVNLGVYRRITELRTPRGRLMFPQAGRYLAVDATLVQAYAPQYPVDQAEEDRIREKRPMATYYGQKGKEMRGYKLVVISDAALNLPLVWKLYPSTVDERKACLELLQRLFASMPDIPAEYLVGDALYDNSRSFNYELVYRWGIHPVFRRSGEYGENYPYTSRNTTQTGIDGVPECGCKDEHGNRLLMKRHSADNFPTLKARQKAKAKAVKEGKPIPAWTERGNWADPANCNRPAARIRWRCVNGNPNCKEISTYPHNDARIYTYLPRAGTSDARKLRAVIQNHRNIAESIFSSLKASQKGNVSEMRARWACDVEVEHLLGARLAVHTARHLIHWSREEAYTYTVVEEQVRAHDLYRDARDTHSAPHNDEVTTRILELRAAVEPAAPPCWEPGHRENERFNYEMRNAA